MSKLGSSDRQMATVIVGFIVVFFVVIPCLVIVFSGATLGVIFKMIFGG